MFHLCVCVAELGTSLLALIRAASLLILRSVFLSLASGCGILAGGETQEWALGVGGVSPQQTHSWWVLRHAVSSLVS